MGRDRSRSPRRFLTGRELAAASVASIQEPEACRCCQKVGVPLEFGRDCEYCSSECYRGASLGKEAQEWDAGDVASWIVERGCRKWSRCFKGTDGLQLLVHTNERTLRKFGIPRDSSEKVMRSIISLRRGAWGMPEPTLVHLPLQTVAFKGKQWNNRWLSVLSDEPRRSFSSYCPRAIDERTAWEWYETLYNNLPWADLCDTKYQESGKTAPRRTVFVVNEGCNCTYQYSGVKVAPMAEPDFLAEIRKTCAKICGFSDAEMPNACNINLYRSGQDSVGWHTDNEALFDAEACDATILSLSLGAPRNFYVKMQDKWSPNEAPKTEIFPLRHGDLATMEGKFQKYYLHAIPKEPRVQEARINLTWRWITRHNKQSGCRLIGDGN